jgi:hypothetical protein
VLDDRNGGPATQVFDQLVANRIKQLQIRLSCRDSQLPLPARPYKANVGGSIPSAPTNQITHLRDFFFMQSAAAGSLRDFFTRLAALSRFPSSAAL